MSVKEMSECNCVIKGFVDGSSIWKSVVASTLFNLFMVFFGRSFFGFVCSVLSLAILVGGVCVKVSPDRLELIKTKDVVSSEALQKHCETISNCINRKMEIIIALVTWESPFVSFMAFLALVGSSIFLRNIGLFVFSTVVINSLLLKNYINSFYCCFVGPKVSPHLDNISKKFNKSFEKIPRVENLKSE
ncbi:hypothetical protein FG386_003604 [Cryptosporidium ryanae]|uniref:uncharacterized protein n=1 Tax=Cryptosporidium ryanae TaxID=515981 RepID=UPI00351A0D1B|nr:hypothetical protein FG386_003604 [Cryptosporidium ryanae]